VVYRRFSEGGKRRKRELTLGPVERGDKRGVRFLEESYLHQEREQSINCDDKGPKKKMASKDVFSTERVLTLQTAGREKGGEDHGSTVREGWSLGLSAASHAVAKEAQPETTR